MPRKHTFEIGPVVAYATTKTVARERAIEHAAEWLRRLEQPPVFIPAPPDVDAAGLLVHASRLYWSYVWVSRDGSQHGWTCGHATKADATLTAISHLADVAIDGTRETLERTIAWLDGLVLPWSAIRIADVRPSIVAALERRHRTTAEYQRLRAAGISDAEAHAQASHVI